MADEDAAQRERERRGIININSCDGIPRTVILQPSAPITSEDLRAALNALFPDQAAELHADLAPDIGRPGMSWSLDILLAVAQLSPAHAERITRFLGCSYEKLKADVERIAGS